MTNKADKLHKPHTLQQFAKEMLEIETYPIIDIFKFNLESGRYITDITYSTLIKNHFEDVRLRKTQINKIQKIVDEYADLLMQFDIQSAKKCILSRQSLEKLAKGESDVQQEDLS